jgi:hypothetical protein
MKLSGVRVVLALAVLGCGSAGAVAGDWWMLKNTDNGRECGPPPELDGTPLGPEEILKRFEGTCKLMDETPSLDLENVMVACEGNINQVFVFTKTKESCDKLAEE